MLVAENPENLRRGMSARDKTFCGIFGTYVLAAWRPLKREAIVNGLSDQLAAADALDVPN
jgi:hypothetical protein